MTDLSHQWGADLQIGTTGDLATASGVELGQQRVLRRLLTNVEDYIWQLTYGAGLARFIGEPGSAIRIRALIRSQIFKEAAVARSPEPVIDVQLAPDGAPGTVYVDLRYTDSASAQTSVVSFSLGA